VTDSILAPLDRIPADIFRAADYETLARRFIAPPAYAYIAGGSGNDATLAANRAAFDEATVTPRLLRDVSGGHTGVMLGRHTLPHPILLAPVAHQRLAHAGAELETARGAAAMQGLMVVSTLSSQPLEAIAPHVPQRWFQLYFQPQREVTRDLVKRAEAAGYTALVVTLDAAIQLPSLRALHAGFTMPAKCSAANLRDYSQLADRQPEPATLAAGESRIFRGAMRAAPTWRDLDWLQQQSALPLWIKGVQHPDDARELKARGIAGQIVSNHGGRTLDGAPASLHALPAIRAAVGDEYPLLLDSGIRSGSDIFQAIAHGADAVLIGRLQMYALSVAGALGVAHLLKLLREELEVCMAMTGCASLADIRNSRNTK
jgi:isopentenyl diphosphate isomerase/L-lactate dehydrogenase-like FMN-dependent dehydrogenase